MGEPKKKDHVGEKRKAPEEETTPGKRFKRKKTNARPRLAQVKARVAELENQLLASRGG